METPGWAQVLTLFINWVATNNCYLSLLGFAGFSKLIQLVTSTNSAFLSYFYQNYKAQ